MSGVVAAWLSLLLGLTGIGAVTASVIKMLGGWKNGLR